MRVPPAASPEKKTPEALRAIGALEEMSLEADEISDRISLVVVDFSGIF